jgi:hypothetical protein
MSIDDFLSGLDYEQLAYCHDKAKLLLQRKEDEKKVPLWVVSDEDLNYAWFKENDYTSAVDRMIEEIRREAARDRPVHVGNVGMGFYLNKRRYRESEVAELLKA